MKNITIMIIIAILSFGCSGGSSGDTSSNSTVTNTGIFIDSPVQGLKYSTTTLSGYTDNKGHFNYKTGEAVDFFIGNLKLGSVTGANIITPLTLNGESDLNNISNKSAGLARILQTLDNNSSDGASLVIPDTLRDLNISGLNLDADADADLNTILARAQVKTGINYILKDAISAKSEMKKQIEASTTYPVISSLYNATTGTKFYLLRLIEESNIHMSLSGRNSYEVGLAIGSGNGITIYNLNLNIITKHNGKLYAGTYIIKVQHDNVKNSIFLVNYPSLADQTAHTKLKNGTFSSIGGKYYSLHMPSSSTVDFTYNSGLAGNSYPAYIYDTNLSLISHIGGTISLNTGDYVIFFDHGATDRTPNPLTVSSSVLP